MLKDQRKHWKNYFWHSADLTQRSIKLLFNIGFCKQTPRKECKHMCVLNSQCYSRKYMRRWAKEGQETMIRNPCWALGNPGRQCGTYLRLTPPTHLSHCLKDAPALLTYPVQPLWLSVFAGLVKAPGKEFAVSMVYNAKKIVRAKGRWTDPQWPLL